MQTTIIINQSTSSTDNDDETSLREWCMAFAYGWLIHKTFDFFKKNTTIFSKRLRESNDTLIKQPQNADPQLRGARRPLRDPDNFWTMWTMENINWRPPIVLNFVVEKNNHFKLMKKYIYYCVRWEYIMSIVKFVTGLWQHFWLRDSKPPVPVCTKLSTNIGYKHEKTEI